MIAPILLFVYNRIEHTKKVIEALQQCNGASDSELYIFSDAAKEPEGKRKVEDLRAYLTTITGFKAVHVTNRPENRGLAYNIIKGVSTIINTYQKAIVLEDDIICAPNFIDYMNDALTKYEKHDDIFAISGYHPQINLGSKNGVSVYKNYRNSSWGWATWADRWNKVDWEVKGDKDFFNSKKQRKAFDRGGEDLSWMLWKQQHGMIDSWAIRFCFAQYCHKAFTVFPFKSLVANIGLDGSGRHSENTDKFSVKLSNSKEKLILPDIPEVDGQLMKAFRKKHKLSLKKKIKKVVLMDLLNGWNR